MPTILYEFAEYEHVSLILHSIMTRSEKAQIKLIMML